MRVLVVEDDAKIASFVVRGLKQAGYAVDHAPDGETGHALADSTSYDAMVVDIMGRTPRHASALLERAQLRG